MKFSFSHSRLWAAIIVFLFFKLTLTAQPTNLAIIPDTLRANASSIVRSENIEFEVLSDNAGVLRHHVFVTILNSESDANLLVLGYDKDTKIKRLEARIYDALGLPIREAKKDEIQDVAAVESSTLYQDSRWRYVKLVHSVYPYTVEFLYEQHISGISFAVFPDWDIQQWAQSVEKSNFSVILPAGGKLHYQTLNTDIRPTISTTDKGKQRFAWSVENLPAIKKEILAPTSSQVLPSIITSPDRFAINNYQGSMANWSAFGKFIHQLFAGRDQLPAAVKTEVKQLLSGAATNAEKIDRLYRYLQSKTRYVSVQLGIGGWQPFDANYVSENKFGDCKALTNYMKALLQEAGIPSTPALIYAGEADYEPQEQFTTSAFNHVILYVPGEDTWLECTSQNLPTGYLPSYIANHKSLLVQAEGARLITTPRLAMDESLRSRRTNIQVQPDGLAKVQVATQYRGEAHEIMREMMHYLGEEDQRKFLVKTQEAPVPTLAGYRVTAAPDRPEAALSYSLEFPRYASVSGKRLFIPVNKFFAYNDAPPQLQGERRLPLHLTTTGGFVDTVDISIPAEYRLETAPVAEEVSHDYGIYKSSFSQLDDERVRWVRHLTLRPTQLPASAYEELRQFMVKVAKADSAVLVLVKKQT